MTGGGPHPSPAGSAEQGLDARTEALLRRLVRRDAAAGLRKLLRRTRPQDIAAVMEHLTWAEQRRLFQQLDDPDFAARVLSHLSEASTREVGRLLGVDQLSALLDRMEPDDATDVVASLPDEVRAEVLADLGDDQTDVRDLLSWPEDTAGRIMSPLVFTQPKTATCAQAIRAIQERHTQVETIYYVYVVDDAARLVGVSSLRALITAPANRVLAEMMTRDVLTVGPTQDQEEVAQFVARYDLLAVPVVDDDGHILGVVTVDDVIDVIREEAAEDMMLMAGVVEPEGRNVLTQGRSRAGWLVATLVGGILASEIIGWYGHTMERAAMLSGFVPVIMGMGGNVGIQSATLAVRGIATGRVQIGGALQFVLNEAQVGALLGTGFALALGTFVSVRHLDQPILGLLVGGSIFLAISVASAVGASVPIFLDRAGVDPAVATGPFVTTGVDLLGILIYFNVARLLLGLG